MQINIYLIFFIICVNHCFGQNESTTSLTIANISVTSPAPKMLPTLDTSSAMNQFPGDFMTDEVRSNGGVIVHFLILIYCCLSLAVICDSYFVPALQFISDSLSIPSDISGATFMAIGTSAPELFSSVIGVFITGDDIGIGTIIGSAVFNLIGIPAACGFAVYFWCSNPVVINFYPVLRDSIFYTITILFLILCIKDNNFDWVEAATLIVVFCVYILILYFNAVIVNSINKSRKEDYSQLPNNEDMVATEESPLISKKTMNITNESMKNTELASDYKIVEIAKTDNQNYLEDESDGDEEWIEKNKFFKCLMFPVNLLFRVTLPKPTKFCFFMTFIISVLWIGALTYVCVWMVTIIGFTLNIPNTVSGITILAVGTSIPELISSVIVIKKAGLADMAISNAIGSNIFDILISLAVPFLVKSLINLAKTGDPSVPINSTALPKTALTLLLTVLALLITLKFTKWAIGRTVGIVCTLIYAVFLIFSTILEINA